MSQAVKSGCHGDTDPLNKKSRLLGGADLNSEKVMTLLKARSSHVGALAQVFWSQVFYHRYLIIGNC